MADFLAAATAVRASGAEALALYAAGWTELLIFEGSLISEGGAAYFRDWCVGKNASLRNPSSSPDSSLMAALNDYSMMVHVATLGAVNWEDAVDMVARGTAAMVVMNDGAIAEFLRVGARPGVDVDAVPMPMNGRAFIFTAEGFALPAKTANPEGALAFLDVVGSPRAQSDFAAHMLGSIPARMDADATVFDLISQREIADYGSAAMSDLAPDMMSVAPRSLWTAVMSALDQLGKDGDVNMAALAIQAAYTNAAFLYSY
jgi:glucose/mannose transport system substrate-binding protein